MASFDDNEPVGDKTLPKDHPYYNIPINLNILTPTYTNNAEYRETLKNLCFLRYPETFPEGGFPEGTDPESCHEMTYDIDNMTYALDFVWQNTKNHPAFIELYKNAAMIMFTEDLEVGLAILFSYDYLCYFYPVFREYMVFARTPARETAIARTPELGTSAGVRDLSVDGLSSPDKDVSGSSIDDKQFNHEYPYYIILKDKLFKK
jgi:hypothetical protein